MKHGMVVGKFYPPHTGHEHLIRCAAATCERVTVVVAPSRRESIPLESRLEWLREIFAGAPHVRFAGTYDDVPIDYHDAGVWDAHCAIFKAAVGPHRIDAVFSSEAYGPELARRFGAEHVAIDPGRLTHDVSGTAVRKDPVAHWHLLSAPVRAWFVRRVVAVGAESTGTTTLTEALAAHYRGRGGVWASTQAVPEYGRELTELKVAQSPEKSVFAITWKRDDFEAVARRQNELEDIAARAGSPLLFCDTDARATAVWEERYLGSASECVLRQARQPSLYLLTDHRDVPFHDDGLRDGEHLREWMTGRFADVLAASGVPYMILNGSPESRLAQAIHACDALIAQGWALAEPL